MSLYSLLADVSMNPDPSGLPGSNVLQKLVNGAGFWAGLLALAGLIAGAAVWAIGSHSNAFGQVGVGRKMTAVSGIAALLIGGSVGIVNFFLHLGGTVH